MSGRGSTGKRCGCRDPETKKQLGARCPDLRKRHHGEYFIEVRIDTTGGRRKLKRSGYAKAEDAEDALDRIRDLVRLADDDATRAKVGDLIWEASRGGGQLPGVDTVRQRLALGAGPGGSGETFGQAWATWLAGKRKLRPSSRRRLEQIGEHWLLPVLADVLLERFNAMHCAMVFDRIELFNEEIAAAADEDRPPVLDGDVRTRPQVVGVASQHRVFAALREFLNHLWKQRHVVTFNPVYAVELEPEETPEAQRRTAAQAARFLAVSADDPLHLLFRLVLLRGLRRGEVVGLRWSGADLDAGYLTVERPILQVGGVIIESRPKSTAGVVAGKRRAWLDATSNAMVKAHRKAQLAARLRASTAWQDNDPDPLPRGRLTVAAGLRVPPVQGDRPQGRAARHQAARGPALRSVAGPGRRGRSEDPPGAARPHDRGDDGPLHAHPRRAAPGRSRGGRPAGRGGGLMTTCPHGVPTSAHEAVTAAPHPAPDADVLAGEWRRVWDSNPR